MITDAAMFVLFLLLMERHLIAGALHEWLGIAMGILFLLHNALNYKWFSALFKGKYGALRIVQTTVNFLLWIAMLGCMISGVLVSESIFPAGAAGYELGRFLHLVATAWSFVLMSVHLGLHWHIFLSTAKRVSAGIRIKKFILWGFRILALAICAYGGCILLERRFWEELFYLIDYTKEYDYAKNAFVYLIESGAMAALFAGLTYYAKKLFLHHGPRRLRRNKTESVTGGET